MTSQRAENDSDILTIRMMRRAIQDNLDAMEEELAMQAHQRAKNPHYPSEEAMFEEFPHYKEQRDAYRAALAEDEAR